MLIQVFNLISISIQAQALTEDIRAMYFSKHLTISPTKPFIHEEVI